MDLPGDCCPHTMKDLNEQHTAVHHISRAETLVITPRDRLLQIHMTSLRKTRSAVYTLYNTHKYHEEANNKSSS